MASPTAWLASCRFHRSFILPADPDANRPGQLRVTYSDIGYGSSDTVVPSRESDPLPTPKAVVVLIGGLMGGRYTCIRQHDFCHFHKIRMLVVDRPGMGGSDPVPLSERMTTWLATFPALLAHLDIPHVAISSHSGGAVYAMNTLLHHRKLLHPTKPCISFLAPWVYPGDSGTMKLLTWLPSAGPAHFDSLVKVMNNYVSPMVGFSSGASDFISSGMFRSSEQDSISMLEVEAGEKSHDKTREDVQWMKEARTLIMKYLIAENISGSSDEATLLLRKSKSVLRWGGDSWADYNEATKLIAAEYSHGLHVNVFHAATDKLNGPGGAKYFDGCWKDVSSMSTGEIIKYESHQCEGTDHESIIDPLIGPLRDWLLSLVKDENDAQ